MPRQLIDRLTPVLRGPVLSKLQTMARKHVGGSLNVLLGKDEQLVKILLGAGEEVALPDFCRILRSTPEGMQGCTVCRWLTAVTACCKGLSRYSCHGGLSAVVAPAVLPGPDSTDFVVVSSCAFALPDRERGWRAARAHAQGMRVNLRELRDAYYEIPALEEKDFALAADIVETAASVIRDAAGSGGVTAATPAPVPGAQWEEAELARMLDSALTKAVGCKRGKERRTSAPIAEVVVAIVTRNPAMPFTVGSVARAARVTPNHFSTLFHRHTGKTFMDFLTEERIALSQRMLRDLTLSVNEAGTRAGFRDPAYFSRRFKQITGLSPSEWRAAL